MSDQDTEPARLSEPAPPAATPPPQAPPPAPAVRGGWAAPLALLLAVLALAAVAFGGWHVWQLERGDHAGSDALAQLRQRMQALDAAQAKTRAQRDRLRQTMQAHTRTNEQNARDLRTQMDTLTGRTRHLEDAVANLSSTQVSAHDKTTLDETETLLRMAAQRYTLFHDGNSALQAYALAAQTLDSIDDPTFSGVRRSIAAERSALAATHPTASVDDAAALARLRTRLAALPPRPLDTAAPTAPAHGFWQRTWQVLSHVVSISRDDGAPAHLADARLARELVALDVAQAQAALLAHDPASLHAALTRVDAGLAAGFDNGAPSVRQARAEVARLQARDTSQTVKLGAALTELRNLRRVRDAGEPAAAPASAASAAVASPSHADDSPGGSPR